MQEATWRGTSQNGSPSLFDAFPEEWYLSETVPSPNVQGRPLFWMTTCLQFPSPKPLNALGCGVPPSLGTDVLSACGL